MRIHMERTYPSAEYQLLKKGPDLVPKRGLNFSIGEIKPILKDPGVARRQINRWMGSRKWKLLDIHPASSRFFLYEKHTGRMYEGVLDVKLNWR